MNLSFLFIVVEVAMQTSLLSVEHDKQYKT